MDLDRLKEDHKIAMERVALNKELIKSERLERIATAALQGMLANPNIIDCHTTTALSIISDRAIKCAEFMIEKIYDRH